MRLFRTSNPEATFAFGFRLGLAAGPGTLLALEGDLGAGKTLLTQGLARGLGVQGPVTSPTFVLMVLHENGRLPLAHVDLYRLCDEEEALAIGLPEYLEGPGVAVVEWADRIPEIFPGDLLRIRFAFVEGEPEARLIIVEATGPRHEPLERTVDAG